MPTLSLCLIAKNEERYLERCLASVRGLADEIVLVDTGSTDATVAIARSFGARVAHVEWTDDFSAARNASLELATGDWILSLDADETIAARDHAAIREAIGRRDLDAFTCVQRNYTASVVIGWTAGNGGYEEGAPYPGFLDIRIRRLFRRHPWIRFRNRVHETIVSTNPARPLRKEQAQWVIHHYGKVGDAATLAAKAAMYLRIGQRKVEESPTDPQAHWELAVQLAERGDAAAARRCFERVMTLAPGYRDTALRLALCDVDLGQYETAITSLRAVARTEPRMAAEAAFAEGTVRRKLGDDVAAEEAFRRALHHNPRFLAAAQNLALLLEQHDRLEDALACVEAALQQDPAHAALKVLRTRLIRSLLARVRQLAVAAQAALAR